MWRRIYDEGGNPPAAFFNCPEIPDRHHIYWDAFTELGTERQYGMGVGPIPRSKIESYAVELGFVDDNATIFTAIIRQVDEEYVRISNTVEKTKDRKEQAQIPIDDTHGVRAMFRDLDTRKKSAQHKKQDGKK